jgi:hypothetical protein
MRVEIGAAAAARAAGWCLRTALCARWGVDALSCRCNLRHFSGRFEHSGDRAGRPPVKPDDPAEVEFAAGTAAAGFAERRPFAGALQPLRRAKTAQ